MASSCSASPMRSLEVRRAGIAHPFGDDRSVQQPWPSAFTAEETDPFLMCDDYTFEAEGVAQHEDEFPVDWHPHRGIDVVSYIKRGRGRHADSLGNRVVFDTPGMQWMSCGSGVYHAEGGATPAGEVRDGFQIWVNVPALNKMDDPRYGTAGPSDLPLVELASGAFVRVLAGRLDSLDAQGPFLTAQPVLMLDLELQPGAQVSLPLPGTFDTCFVYAYRGAGAVAGTRLSAQHAMCLDASDAAARLVTLVADDVGVEGLGVLLFAGPIVMNTQAQIEETFRELRSGDFPPKRVPWNYRRAAAKNDH